MKKINSISLLVFLALVFFVFNGEAPFIQNTENMAVKTGGDDPTKDPNYTNYKKNFWTAYQDYREQESRGIDAPVPVDPAGVFEVNELGKMDLKINHNSNTNSIVPPGAGTDAVSAYTFAQSNSAYSAIAGGTVLYTGAWDDGSTIGLPIGFSFTFNGVVYTTFGLNANGYIIMGSGTPTQSYCVVQSGLNSTLISGLGADLIGNATGEIRYQTIGSSPNLQLVVQWKNCRKYGGSASDNYNFQIILNQTTNTINIKYGTCATITTLGANTCGDVATDGPGVGIATSTADYNIRKVVNGTNTWAASVAGTVVSDVCQMQTTNVPASGQMYTWTPGASSGMTYVSSNTLQLYKGVPAIQSTTTNQIVQIQVVTTGTTSPLSVSNFNLGTNGSTAPLTDITNAKLYYTGTSSVFASTTLFGTAVSPNGTFNIAGSQALSTGTNYFWLTYDIPAGGVVPDLLDAQCNTITGSGTIGTAVPTTIAPAGNRFVDKYCVGQFANSGSPFGLYITNVTLGTINNTSGFDPNGNFPYAYTANLGLTTTVTQGSSYTISITEGTSTYPNGFSVWVDWNQNGTFTDAGEYFNIGLQPSGGSTTITGTIVVPANATVGSTRMRVRSNYASAPLTTDACTTLSYGETEDYSINVAAASNMAYVSSTSTQTNVTPFTVPSVNTQILGVQIVTSGSANPLNATSFTLNTNGSTNAATDITNAKLWYTGTSSTFATTTQVGSTFSSPNGTFNITGSQALSQGTNYFWLTYDCPGSATQGDVVDAECNSLTVGSAFTPTVQAPAGNRLITSPMAGTYTIGLGMFNRLTGKNLQEVKLTRRVKQLVAVNNDNSSGRKLKNSAPGNEITSYISDNNTRYRETEVTEEYSELYENGKKYTGTLYAEGINTVTTKVNRREDYSANDMLNNYATITAAITDLNNRGVSGAVTFLLMDATYATETYPIQINSGISGISATNSVTIKPNTGVTSTIPGSIASNAALRILSNYVTIDGSNSGGTDRSLTIQNNNATAPNVVLFGSTGTTPITNVALKNTIITTTVQASSSVVISDAATIGNPGYFNTVTIQNNNINTAFIGVYANGGTVPENGLNLFVTNNTMVSTGSNALLGYGIYMQGVNNASVTGNEVGNMVNNTSNTYRVGIWLATGTENVTVEKNKLHDLQYTGASGYGASGIKVSTGVTGSNVTLRNNMIYNITADADSYATYSGTYSPIGIYCFSTQSGLNIYNNSVYLYGNTINYSAAGYSIALDIETGTTADIRNNILVNNLGRLAATGAGAVALIVQTSNAQLTQCNNNCYSCNSTGGGTNNIGQIAGVNQTTLAGWQTATAKDGNSINVQPLFTSTTDLHIQASDLSVSGRGTYLSAVTDDYDGDGRATAQSVTLRPVDIGCDQYTPSGYTGNTTVLNGSVYTDGNAKSVEIVSGTFTASSVKQFPGVRTPYNTLMRPANGNGNNNTEPKENKNSNSKPKSREGKSGAEKEMMTPVNTPWIYWEINNFVPTSEPVVLRYYYNVDQLATITESTMRLTYWNGSAWDNNFVQSVNTTSHYIQVTFPTGVTWPSNLSFAIEDPNNPLPVTISSFNALAAGRDAIITWVTESETNNRGFYLERRSKINAVTYGDWASVVFVEGHGNSGSSITYNYSDRKLNAGDYQYRLKQVDYNGNFEYHGTNSLNDVIIGKPLSSDMSQNYPNPSNPKTKIDYQLPFDGKVSIRIYDLAGREVLTLVDKSQSAGYYTTEFDGTNLASGIYFYRIVSEGGGQKFTKTLKMVLVK